MWRAPPTGLESYQWFFTHCGLYMNVSSFFFLLLAFILLAYCEVDSIVGKIRQSLSSPGNQCNAFDMLGEGGKKNRSWGFSALYHQSSAAMKTWLTTLTLTLMCDPCWRRPPTRSSATELRGRKLWIFVASQSVTHCHKTLGNNYVWSDFSLFSHSQRAHNPPGALTSKVDLERRRLWKMLECQMQTQF